MWFTSKFMFTDKACRSPDCSPVRTFAIRMSVCGEQTRSLLFHCLDCIGKVANLSLCTTVSAELSASHSNSFLFCFCITCSEHFNDSALVWVEASDLLNDGADGDKSFVWTTLAMGSICSEVAWFLLRLRDDVTMVQTDKVTRFLLLNHLLI